MKSVLRHKFDQNKSLRDKLTSTGNMKLQECSTDMYWSTGLTLDSPSWSKGYDYKGSNRLGHLIEEVREAYLPITTSPISKTCRQMPISDKSLDNVSASVPDLSMTSTSSDKTVVQTQNVGDMEGATGMATMGGSNDEDPEQWILNSGWC